MTTATKVDHRKTNDPKVVRDWLRTLHISDVWDFARGKDTLGKPVKCSKVVKEEAISLANLITAGNKKVRSVLKAIGCVYTGTSGWWISALVTPEGEIGFLNTAKGVAVVTDAFLDDDTIEALTVPSQPEGNLVSGAAAWTSPDAGEGHNAKSPPGWKQLLVDVRTNNDRPTEQMQVKWRLVCYGLKTCYKDVGLPVLELDPSTEESKWRVPPKEWHFTDEQKVRVNALIKTWMLELCQKISVHVPNGSEIMLLLNDPNSNHEDVYKLTSIYPDHYNWTSTSIDEMQRRVFSLRGDAARAAVEQLLKDFWIERVYFGNGRGLRSGDLSNVQGMLVRAIFLKLEAVAQSFLWCLEESKPWPYNASRIKPHGDEFKALLDCAAMQIGKVFLFGVQDSAKEVIEKQMVGILYENGPVYPMHTVQG